MKTYQAVLLVSIVLSGCIVQRAVVANRAQTELVGLTKTQLLSCAGAPHRQERSDGLEFLTYDGGGGSVGGGVLTQTAPNMGAGVGFSSRRYCEATFLLKSGVVQSVNYQGRTGGLVTKGEQCAYIVENCLGQPRQVPSASVEAPIAPPSKTPGLALPAGWEERALPDPMRANGTLLYAINRTLDAGTVIGAVRREEITDLMTFAKSMRAGVENRLVGAQSTDFVVANFRGKQVLLTEVGGTSSDGLRLCYLMAVVEGGSQIGIINSWVMAANFANQRQRLIEFSSHMSQQF